PSVARSAGPGVTPAVLGPASGDGPAGPAGAARIRRAPSGASSAQRRRQPLRRRRRALLIALPFAPFGTERPSSPVSGDLPHLLERGAVLPRHAGDRDQTERLIVDPVGALVRVPLGGVWAQGLDRGQQAPPQRAAASGPRPVST